ncbi:MAG: ABC transporter substrate-binding protein [Chloroflexi bacterium]|nr:ABC transporter substrate-binding protein [Chloroflexota bacterium]MDA1218130.1 ABC transporter substrate-binding protein [Chloroflexota bacterium]PKB57874.1 MAG: hypothetical protein BZY73_00530 [SAR202 cluster bacterium Casp-Chloro-G3]
METFRTVFYTPIYVSVAGGFLREEGLDVTFSTCPAQYPHPLSALKHGQADVVGSGIMRCIIALDWGAESVPLHFAEINARDGFFVLSRRPNPDFTWDVLNGATVIPVGFSPMPWASFQYALRKHKIDPNSLTLIHGLSLDEAVQAFQQNRAAYIHLPEPAAEQLIAAGTGHLVSALGTENGHIAYSSFAATSEFLNRESDTVHRFVRGFARALGWLETSNETEIADAISPFFTETPKELLTQSVARYKAQGTWPVHPALEQPEYEGLQDILMGAGLVKERQPYEKVVSREFA